MSASALVDLVLVRCLGEGLVNLDPPVQSPDEPRPCELKIKFDRYMVVARFERPQLRRGQLVLLRVGFDAIASHFAKRLIFAIQPRECVLDIRRKRCHAIDRAAVSS